MALGKTERGRTALQAHAASGLSLAERRVLILCDGKRSRDEVIALLGAGARSQIERLLQEDYLTQGGAAPASQQAGPAHRQTGPASSVPAAASPSTPPTPQSAQHAAASRRSLAASKMYVLDMLQLQRDPGSVSLRAEILASPGEDELVYRLMQALRHLQAVASAGYVQRVSDRLAEILPEPFLPRLDHMRGGWLDPAPAAVA